MIERSFKIGVNAGFSVAPVVHVNQYDHDEVWYFTLIQEDGQVYTPSTGSIVGVKADGNVIINSGTVNSSGQIVINETQQMTAAVGNAVYELVFDAGTHGTANFIVRVEPKPGDNATVSDSDISLIEEAIVMGSRIVAYGSPLVATAASQMTSRQNVYVYTGSESGYTNGHWYYWNGSAWTDGGVYNAVAVNTDKTLSVENMAADGKATGDAITDLKNAIDSVREPVEDLTGSFILNSGITTNGAIGSVVDISPVQNTGYNHIIVPCQSGDLFNLTGVGASSFRLWSFVDTDFKLISQSASYADGTYSLTAPSDGYLIVSCSKAKSYSLTASQFTNQSERIKTEKKLIDATGVSHIRRVTNPHELEWKMGTFTKAGIQGGTFTDRMYTVCKVKKGSTVSAFSSEGVNISFGYKINDDATSLDYYRSYNYGSYEVTQDCTVYIGVLYNTPVYLNNDILLDKITIDLIVEDFTSKYRKHVGIAYGNPVPMYYEGQHIDTTGWTNATTDINAIHSAFDALMTASNGYIEKTDLGEAYEGYHMFQYTTKPVGMHVTVFKVPKVAIICCQHGNEKMSAYAMYYLMYDLIHNPTKNPVLSYLRSNCSISFVPIANPWGFLNTSRLNEGGVNLNRNWPTYNWESYNDETSVLGGINYKGSFPASAPQTKLMMQFLRNNQDAIFAIDLHTNGTDTEAWYEISSTILCETEDKTSPDYPVQHSYVEPSKVFTNHIKAWLDENYGTDLGNVFYGNVTLEPDRPTASQWSRESNNMVGITYEVFCGSSNGYLGEQLYKYSADSIKASAENLGTFLITMIKNAMEQ